MAGPPLPLATAGETYRVRRAAVRTWFAWATSRPWCGRWTTPVSSWPSSACPPDRPGPQHWPAPCPKGEPPGLPFWHGEGLGRPFELGETVGEFLAEMERRLTAPANGTSDWLEAEYGIDKLSANNLVPPKPGEEVKELIVRVRTIGDIISTGMIESRADSVDDIIAEIAAARVTERGSRADDKTSEAAMEDRKKAGYF